MSKTGTGFGIGNWLADRIDIAPGDRILAADAWADFTAWRESRGLPESAFWFRRGGFCRLLAAHAVSVGGGRGKSAAGRWVSGLRLRATTKHEL